MAELTLDQQKAIAMASARLRLQGQQIQAPEPTIGQQIGRQLGLTGRAIAEGVADVASPFADALAAGANGVLSLTGSNVRFPEQSQAVSSLLTNAGVPKPEGTIENIANAGGRFITGMAAGKPLNDAILAKAPNAPANFVPQQAKTDAAKVLEQNGIPLDKSQATGSTTLQRVRSAVTDHPITAGTQQAFTQDQQKAFNRAVLRQIGVDSDEATQDVMLQAKKGISKVFNQIGQDGAKFDDQLQTAISNIVDNAEATVPKSELTPLNRNIDDLLNAVDDSGNINGDVFVRIRSRLGELARRPGGLGQRAQDLEGALMDALERSNPGQKQVLSDARDQWRTLRIIQSAIGKGADRDISPLKLSNAIATKAQQAMSVYGQGGNQDLVKLAQAARTILPEKLPNSGTVPRGLMQAPLRSLATAVPYVAAQKYLLSQPGAVNPGGLRGPLIFATGGAISR